MSTHPSTKHKRLAWIVILAQVLARASTDVATVLQPTPQLAQEAAHDLGLADAPWAWRAGAIGRS